MTAEKVTTSSVSTRMDLRQRPAVSHNAKAKAKQASAAISVPRGARWRQGHGDQECAAALDNEMDE